MKILKILVSVCFPFAFLAFSLTVAGNTIHFGDETAYLQTDRNVYIAGENIFYKLYLIDSCTHKLSGISRIAYLVLRNDSNIPIAKIKINANGGSAYGSIFLPDSLKSGTYQIVVFTNWMRNAGEESFFAKEIFIANRFDNDLALLNTFNGFGNKGHDSILQKPVVNAPLLVKTNKSQYLKREKISLSLAFPEGILADTANLSISVTEDIPGRGNDFSTENNSWRNAGNSKRRLSEKNKFLPEQKGEIIQGRVINRDSGKAVAGTNVFLSAADSLVNLQYYVTDSTGMFRFLLNDYYYGKDLYFNIKDIPVGRQSEIIPEDKFELKNTFVSSQHPDNQLLKEYVLKSQDIVTIQKTYEVKTVSEMRKKVNSNFSCPQLFYKPNYRISPADFVPLDDFAEMAKEIIPPQLNLRKHNDMYTATMADENLHLYMDEEPVVFLDGVLINDVNQLQRLGSKEVKHIELVCTRFNCGELIFPGILAVFSKNEEIRNIRFNSPSLHTQLETFHPCSIYINQSYAQEIPGNHPDFRQLLYWNPDVEVSASHNPLIEFYASDYSGNYTIRIEGVTSGGVPVSISTSINVK